MMTGDTVGDEPISRLAKSRGRMLSACRGVVDASPQLLGSGVNIGGPAQILLKLGGVLSQIVPESRESTVSSATKWVRKLLRECRYLREVLVKGFPFTFGTVR